MKLFTLFLTLACAAYAQHGRGVGRGMPNAPGSTGSPATQTHGPKTQGMTQAQQPGTQTPAQTKVVRNINKNPQLVARLTPLLPSGMTLEQAAAGFKNQGQFIAALNASKSLNIPFADLKAKMTGPGRESLGRAIHELRPDLDSDASKQAATTATQQAQELDKK